MLVHDIRKSLLAHLVSLLAVAVIAFPSGAAQASLPSGYTELEYFSISGNGADNNSSTPLKYWLDTGVVTKHDWTFEVAFAYDQLANSSYQSCLLWDGEIGFWNYTPTRNGHPLVSISSTYYEPSYVLQAGKKHVFKLYNGVLLIDGTFEMVFGGTTDYGRGLVLFGSYYGRGDTVPTSRGCDGKFYYARVFNGSLAEVMNLVPAQRDSDGVVGAYDTVAGRFLENAGSGGSFTAGPVKTDVSSEMTIVSVLRSGTRNAPAYSPVVMRGGAKLKAGRDYSFAVMTNDAGTAIMSVTGVGTYAGETAEARFQSVLDLKSGYVELEYLRSSLIQTDNMPYIDTGFVPDGNTRVDFSFTVHPHVSQAFSPFGKLTSDYKRKLQVIGLYGSNRRNQWEIDFGNGAQINATAEQPYGPGAHTFSLDGNVFKLDGYTYSFASETFEKDGITAYIFTEHIGNTVKYQTPMDLYWMKIWDDGDLVRNYIAVSNTATDAVGLYDTANDVFYGNANPTSAAFIGGPALLAPQPAQRHTIITLR